MTTLVIADLDEALMSDLSRLAARNHLAVETQARLLLRQAVPAKDRLALAEALDTVAAMTPQDRTPQGMVQSDSVAMLREDRDR